jgi:hypothetical protein
VGARADRLLYVCLVVAWVDAISAALVNLGIIHVAGSYWMIAAMFLFLAIAVFARLYTRARRGNRDAQLLLIPFSFFWAVYCVVGVIEALESSGIADLSGTLILYRNPRFDIYWYDFLSFFLISLSALCWCCGLPAAHRDGVRPPRAGPACARGAAVNASLPVRSRVPAGKRSGR